MSVAITEMGDSLVRGESLEVEGDDEAVKMIESCLDSGLLPNTLNNTRLRGGWTVAPDEDYGPVAPGVRYLAGDAHGVNDGDKGHIITHDLKEFMNVRYDDRNKCFHGYGVRVDAGCVLLWRRNV